MQQMCDGGNKQQCMQDSDCASGDDRCKAQSTALGDCIDHASAHHGL
jgi:hypothetical protein